MTRKIIYFTLILISLMLLTTCGDLFDGPKTISQRITAFTDALNRNDRSDIQVHFHPSMTNYNQIASSSVINSGPLETANSPFIITQNSSTDNSGGGKNVTCDFGNKIGSWPNALILWMLQDDTGDYKIRQLNLDLDGAQGNSNDEYILQNIL